MTKISSAIITVCLFTLSCNAGEAPESGTVGLAENGQNAEYVVESAHEVPRPRMETVGSGNIMSREVDPFVSNKLGVHVPSISESQKCFIGGPFLAKDTNVLDLLANFNRERIPERVFHAKGTGAHGYFQVTHDISAYTKASLFSRIGKKTRVFGRFSSSIGESGSADTGPGPDGRGFAVKFYTDEGNFNFLGISTPIFLIREYLLFASLVHAMKRNPKTHTVDRTDAFDFFSLRPETTFGVIMLHSDLGFPNGFRYLDSFPIHTFQFINQTGHISFGRFHLLSNQQGLRNLTWDDSERLAGMEPDYGIKDLYYAIRRGEYPSWSLFIQPVTFEQAQNNKFSVFDSTKVLPLADFPLKPVGQLILNRNPTDHFSQVEQATFAPADLVPGIEMSENDPLFHARSVSYRDAQRYRVGSNMDQLKINRPKLKKKQFSYMRDGSMNLENYDGAVNYFPNSFNTPGVDPNAAIFGAKGRVDRDFTAIKEDNFSQARDFLKTLSQGEMDRLVDNLGRALSFVRLKRIRERALQNFQNVSRIFGKLIRARMNERAASAEKFFGN